MRRRTLEFLLMAILALATTGCAEVAGGDDVNLKYCAVSSVSSYDPCMTEGRTHNCGPC